MPLLQTDKQAMPDKHILLVMISKDENIVNYFFFKNIVEELSSQKPSQ